MAITLYEVSITTFAKALKAVKHILEKAAQHAADKGLDPDSYAQARLSADMRPLAFQVQVVSNVAKKSVWRLTGAEIESWPDTETTLAQLIARTQRTLDLLATVSEATIAVKDEDIVELEMGANGTHRLPAKLYVLSYAVPNIFFHVQTAYSILRKEGVPLGKSDYLSSFMS